MRRKGPGEVRDYPEYVISSARENNEWSRVIEKGGEKRWCVRRDKD